MRAIILTVIFTLIIVSTKSCRFQEETINPVTPKGKIGVGFYVFGDKKRTSVRVTFEESSEIDSVQIEYNGKKLVKREVKDGRIEYTETFENFDSLHQFLITKTDGKQFKIEAIVKPLDFKVEEPFTIHRLKANEIKISSPYNENNEIWLGIIDSYIGGFKEIAEFNQTKDAIIISEATSKRMSVGNAKIALYNVEMKKTGNELFDGTIDVSYKSELSLKVVK